MARIKKVKPYPDKQIIKGALRRVMARSPIVREVYSKSVHPTLKGVRGGKQLICAICKKAFPSNRMAVDHIIPVVPLNKTVHDLSYDEIVNRIFCPIKNLQLLCEYCHKSKTKAEREERKRLKNL
jgi:5-methylcytosine-specific restriction endonuclease McrA